MTAARGGSAIKAQPLGTGAECYRTMTKMMAAMPEDMTRGTIMTTRATVGLKSHQVATAEPARIVEIQTIATEMGQETTRIGIMTSLLDLIMGHTVGTTMQTARLATVLANTTENGTRATVMACGGATAAAVALPRAAFALPRRS